MTSCAIALEAAKSKCNVEREHARGNGAPCGSREAKERK